MEGNPIPFVDLRLQHDRLAGEIEPAWHKILTEASFILGGEVSEFEAEFQEFLGCPHGFGVASGTDALMIALRALDIGPGDQVVIPANTFIATALAVSYSGAQPVLCDVDPVTYCMSPAGLEKAITRKTRAIIPVHLYGQCAPMDEILEIARTRSIPVVEDACQAHGAEYKGRRAGTLGDLGAFSFYPGKNLGACGDAGFLATTRQDLADRVRMLRNYGQTEKYDHRLRGFNSRLDSLQAAVLRIKLRKLREWNLARRQKASMYRELLQDTEVPSPEELRDRFHVYHLYVVRVPERGRDQLLKALAGDRIFAGIHYPIPIHLQEAYRDLGYRAGTFPVTEQAAGEILSLPMYPEITAEQVERVVDRLKIHLRSIR